MALSEEPQARVTDAEPQQKSIHSLILDTGPLIKNAVSISTIINSAEEIFTTPAIISEIRDAATRSRVETTLMPFLKIRTPSPASYDAVVAFSKKTGDHAALSRQDLGILALAYEVHCERNGGSWGLREVPKGPLKRRPGEEGIVEAAASLIRPHNNLEAVDLRTHEPGQLKQQSEGAVQSSESTDHTTDASAQALDQPATNVPVSIDPVNEAAGEDEPRASVSKSSKRKARRRLQSSKKDTGASADALSPLGQTRETISERSQQESWDDVAQAPTDQPVPETVAASTQMEDHQDFSQTRVPEQGTNQAGTAPETITEDLSTLNISNDAPPSPPQTDDSDSDGEWITPSNLASRQAEHTGLDTNTLTSQPSQLDVATMTIDFAMQNVLLQMNLHLLSTNMQRIKHLSSKVLRCHACFMIVKQMDKQFCPRCGGHSLRRVTCSTNSKGEFTIHLAKNYQWNKRGDVYSIPKPIAGTANGKWSGQGGGQGGWGRDLILAEDQKEHVKQLEEQRRANKANDLMDEDYLPGILTGDRGRAGGRVKVGAGKNVNSKKRF